MPNKSEILNGITNINSSKIAAKNTVKIEFKDGSTSYRLHKTNVVTINKDGSIVLNSGGWQTATTKDRINTFSPFTISQSKSIWSVRTSKGSFDFFDNITFDSSGNCLNEITIDKNEIETVKKKIKKFVSQLSKDNLPIPDSGDCWDCLLHTKEGLSMGDINGSNSHLESHIEENYLHGSLLVNAMHEKGFTNEQIKIHYSYRFADTFKRALTAYLQKRLIKNIAVKGRGTAVNY